MGGGHGTFGGSCYLHSTFGGHPSASMAPSIAAANGGFRFRMSERPQGSEFGTGRSVRETQGTRRSLPGAFAARAVLPTFAAPKVGRISQRSRRRNGL